MASRLFWFIRVGIFGGAVLFSIITLGLGASYISKINSFSEFGVSAPAFAGLAVAISVITLLALTPLLVIDIIRKGAITSWVLIELPVVGLLSILWLATAADTAAASGGNTIDCSAADEFDSDLGSLCHTYQGVEAFSFIIWLFLMGYAIFLLAISLISASRGNAGVWKSSVRDTDFFAHNGSTSASVPMTQQSTPAVQQQYPPQQYGTPPPQQYGTPVPQQGYAAQV